MTSQETLQVDDVVQIDPVTQADGFFAGCFMTVTEVRPWGAQGYVLMPRSRGEQPGAAYVRVKHEHMVRVGRAQWLVGHNT